MNTHQLICGLGGAAQGRFMSTTQANGDFGQYASPRTFGVAFQRTF
ncbi:MAG: hypothetical protein WA642_27040 [Steroidobacteraceae bacterium]